MKLYFINVFMAGSNKESSMHSNTIETLSYAERINFKSLRNNIKSYVTEALAKNIPCVNETYIYYNLIKVDDKKKTYGNYQGKVKILDTLKWKTK